MSKPSNTTIDTEELNKTLEDGLTPAQRMQKLELKLLSNTSNKKKE